MALVDRNWMAVKTQQQHVAYTEHEHFSEMLSLMAFNIRLYVCVQLSRFKTHIKQINLNNFLIGKT